MQGLGGGSSMIRGTGPLMAPSSIAPTRTATPTEQPTKTTTPNPSAFEPKATQVITTDKEAICSAVDNCPQPDGSTPEIPDESTGFEQESVESLDQGFEAETGEVAESGESNETEATDESGGSDETEATDESGGSDETEATDESGGSDETESSSGTSESGGTEAAQTDKDGNEAPSVAAHAPQDLSLSKMAAIGGKIGTGAAKINEAVQAVRTQNQGKTPTASATPGGAAKVNSHLTTAKNIGTLLDGDANAADIKAGSELLGDASKALQNSTRAAQVGQVLGQAAKVGTLVGSTVNLVTTVSNGQLQANIAKAAEDPSAQNLGAVANDSKALTTAVQGVTNGAKGAQATLDAVHAASTARTAATTTGRVALRTAETGAHVAASASRAVGRLAPGVNVAMAVVDTAVAATDIAKAVQNPTTDNVVNAAFSSITAAGSIAAASNVPVVSQVGAAVATVSDAAKLVYNNRHEIAAAADKAATTVTNAASNAVSAASSAASSAYTWAKSWF